MMNTAFYFILKRHFVLKIPFTRKSASLELAPRFWQEIFNERLPRMSAPIFFQKERSFEKRYLWGAVIWESHKKNSIIQLI